MGLTQLELSNKLDINNSVLSRIEAGKRPVEDNELIKFADFFEVDSDYLLGRTNVRNKAESNMSFYGGSKNYTPDEIAVMEATLKAYREQLKKMKDDEKK